MELDSEKISTNEYPLNNPYQEKLMIQANNSSNEKIIDNLIVNSNDSANERKNLFIVTYMGFVFMLLFSAFNTAQNMLPEIYSQQLNLSYLGNVTIMVIYIVLGSSNIIIGKVMDYLSFKRAMFIATWGYVVFLSGGVIACSCEDNKNGAGCSEGTLVALNLIFAAVVGFLSCIIWVAQVGYVSALCDEHSKAKFFGIFWALLQFSQVLGNILTAVLLNYVSHFTYFIILLTLASVSALLFLFLPHVDKPQEQGVQKPLNQKIIDFFFYFKVREMQIFSVFCCFAGIIMGFYTGFLYKVIKHALPESESDKDINEKTAFVFICLGIFEFLGGMFCSLVGDKLNKYVMGSISTLLVELALIFSIISYYEKSYPLCFLAAAGFGSGECICNSIINAILTTDMGNKIECFAMFKFTQGIGILVALGLSVALDGERTPFIYLILISLFQIMANLSLVHLKNNIKKFD